MTEKKFVLRKRKAIEDAEGETISYVYTPDDEHEKLVTLTVKGKLIAKAVGLPVKVNDTVIIDTGMINRQQTLDEPDDDDAKDNPSEPPSLSQDAKDAGLN